jgi:dinuclear metal center YbgI/SA1388 family protein
METIAPLRWAASWDNVGLLVGDSDAPLTRVLLTIDCTREVISEARGAGAAIVSYHPVIFEPLKRFVHGAVAFEAARAGVAIYSPHTALDAASGGTNDVLADALEMRERAPLRLLEAKDGSSKLVTFVPETHVDAVSQALFDAGAGRIGNYRACSFRSAGTGTFYGEEGASPRVGQAGRVETVPEVRIELVVPSGVTGMVVAALRRVHPYEEPAFDLVRLAPPPTGVGMGRVGTIEALPARTVVERAKRALGVEQVLVAGPLDLEVTRVAVGAGSGGDLLGDAIAAGAGLFLTGELRHHDALRAAREGIVVVCTRHSTSERGVLRPLAARLEHLLRGVPVSRSAVDREPFSFV